MTIATIRQHNEEQIAIESPYNPDFVAALKTEIPWNSRTWAGKGAGWLVTNAEAGAAVEVASRHFDQVLDIRDGMSEDDVEEAKLAAEIVVIEANQRYILESKERIEGIIEELDAIIARYSFQSKSRIKGAYAKDRALLRHSLANARLPLDELTELHVRGLAAAVRYLESNRGIKRYR